MKGKSDNLPAPLAGPSLSTSYAGQMPKATMPGLSDAAGQPPLVDVGTAGAGAMQIRFGGGGGGGGNPTHMNGYGYPQLHHPQQSTTQQHYAASSLLQQQQPMEAYSYYGPSSMASLPYQQQQQQQQRPHSRLPTSRLDSSAAATATTPNTSCSGISVQALPTSVAANTSLTGATATMFEPVTTTMSSSSGRATPSPQRAPGLHRGRGAAAAAKAQVQAAAAAGHVSPSSLLPLRSSQIPILGLGTSPTANAEGSIGADTGASSATTSTATAGGATHYSVQRADAPSSNPNAKNNAMGMGGTCSPTLSMAPTMSRHHHHRTLSLGHVPLASGQPPHQQLHHFHHHTTNPLGGVNHDGGGGGSINTTHPADMEMPSSMMHGAVPEHVPATNSPHIPPRSQGGASAALSWGSGTNHGYSTTGKQRGATNNSTYSRGSNSNRQSGSRHGHQQQQTMSVMMNNSGNYMNNMYGNLSDLNPHSTGHIGTSGCGVMLMHHNALGVEGGNAGQQPLQQHHHHHPSPQQQQQQQPQIPYYDFITVLPTFVATCLTLQPEDEAIREQLCWTIEAVLRKHINQNAEIRVHGSITTGLALPSSDVDLLAVGYQPMAPLEALQRLSKALLELNEESKNDALRLQELIEAEAQHRRRQLMGEEKERARQAALAAAAGAKVVRAATTPGEDDHRTRESRSSCCGSTDDRRCTSVSLQNLHEGDPDGKCGEGEVKAKEPGTMCDTPSKRLARCGGGSSAKKSPLDATVTSNEVPGMDEVDEAAGSPPDRDLSGHTQCSHSTPRDGKATRVLQRSCSLSPSSPPTDSSTECSSTSPFPLDTRKVFLTANTTVDSEAEFVCLHSESGTGLRFGGTVPGAGATSTCKRGVCHEGNASVGPQPEPDMVAADSEIYDTVDDVEQAEQVFRGQIEKDYSFSTTVDLSGLFAPSMKSSVMLPVVPPTPTTAAAAEAEAAAAGILGVGVRSTSSSSSSGSVRQRSTTLLHDNTSLSSSCGSYPENGGAQLKVGTLLSQPVMAVGLKVGEDNNATHAQIQPEGMAAADEHGSATEAVMESFNVKPAGGAGSATAAEADAAHATAKTVGPSKAAASSTSPEPPTVEATGEKAATASSDAATQTPRVRSVAGGVGKGHFTYVPVYEGPLFFVQSITATRVPVIKLTDKATGTKVDITFAGGEHWRSMQLTRSLLEVFPHARTLILFLKYCVRSLGAGENEPGGVTSFAIYLMVLHFYNECRKRILLLLRERDAAASPPEKRGSATGIDAGEPQNWGTEEAVQRGDAGNNSPSSLATPCAAAAHQNAPPTMGAAPLNLGLLEYMLSEYLARVEQRHEQLIKNTQRKKRAPLDKKGSGDAVESYHSGTDSQEAASALARGSPSPTRVGTGACATIKAVYASNDKERLRAIRQAILGFVGDPATEAAARTSPTTTDAPAAAEESGTERTQELQSIFSAAEECVPGDGVLATLSTINRNISTPSNDQQQQQQHQQQLSRLIENADKGLATGLSTISDEPLVPVTEGAPGRRAPPPHHYILKTVEPQPHEQVLSGESRLGTPCSEEATGRGEKALVVVDTSTVPLMEAASQHTRANVTAAADATRASERPEVSTSIAAATSRVDDTNPEKVCQDSAQPIEMGTTGTAMVFVDGRDKAGIGACRKTEAEAAAAPPPPPPSAPAPASIGAFDVHNDGSDSNAFDAFAVDFLHRQANISDLFLDFCHYYGCAFDYEASGICFTADGDSKVVAKPPLCARRGQHFYMTSPFDPEYDLTARMTHMRDFQWLCWWFAEWGAARQSPQYYGSCSIQYVLQCLSPMSADADCQAVHMALMKQALAATPSPASTAEAVALARNRNVGHGTDGEEPNHGTHAPMHAFQESIGRDQHMRVTQPPQSTSRHSYTTSMSVGGNVNMYGEQQPQVHAMGTSVAAAPPISPHLHPQQEVSLSMSPMHLNSGTCVEHHDSRGGAAVAQRYATAPFPHLQSMMLSHDWRTQTYQQPPQQAGLISTNALDPATYTGRGGFSGATQSSGASTAVKKASPSALRHQGSSGVSTTTTPHETAATRDPSNHSGSLSTSEAGASVATAAAPKHPHGRRPPLQLPCVASREAGDGATSHSATTPMTTETAVAHGYPDRSDDVDGGGGGGSDMTSTTATVSGNRTSAAPLGESLEGTWTSNSAATNTTANTMGGNSLLDRVEEVRASGEEEGEEEEDEASVYDGDGVYGGESVANTTDYLDNQSSYRGVNAAMPQHYQPQLAPRDVQAPRFGEQGVDPLYEAYAPSMTRTGNYGYTALQHQQMPYGNEYMMNRPLSGYVSPQQQQQHQQQQQQQQEQAAAEAAAAAAFYYQAFSQQQQQHQQQPIMCGTGNGFVNPVGSSPSSSYPFQAVYYDVPRHLWQHQQEQQYHTVRHCDSSADNGFAASTTADQEGGSSQRSDGTSSTTATTGSTGRHQQQQQEQQQQQQTFAHTPYMGYPNVVFGGVGGVQQTATTWPGSGCGGGCGTPQTQHTTTTVVLQPKASYPNAAVATATATGSSVNTSSSVGVGLNPSEQQQQQQSSYKGRRRRASQHHSVSGGGGTSQQRGQQQAILPYQQTQQQQINFEVGVGEGLANGAGSSGTAGAEASGGAGEATQV
ncbi:hypothetical protein JKF63_07243 [Porcisia hertigi]|uniref:Polymerase nucleotidyl transferase domain-containing protein n=1 Tax=Porcisia hertigi TaxID=2761500 RepID=A0A836LL84_9TRYP|nr:hypothetical protein JKF63_07243 [Porcisia hertigi]